MEAELLLKFKAFPVEKKQGILDALRTSRQSVEYKEVISKLPIDALEWLAEYWTGLLSILGDSGFTGQLSGVYYINDKPVSEAEFRWDVGERALKRAEELKNR